MEEKGFIQRVFSKTPKRDKIHGRVSTFIGGTCATLLTLGLVTNPIGITLLVVGAAAFGGKAIHHAQKVKK